MANTSQTLLPSLQLPRLKEFNVSGNHLTFVPPNTLSNLSEVRVLDLSSNELPAPPSNAWHSMHHLRVLRMGGNPITKASKCLYIIAILIYLKLLYDILDIMKIRICVINRLFIYFNRC